MLRSVGVLANRANSLIEYWIYLLKEGYSDPEDGELIYSAAGENGIKAKYAGYNVQDLMTPIALVKGQLFSIVARIFGSEGGQLPLEVQSDMSEYPYVKVGRGQTFYTDENGNWVDVCDFEISPEIFATKAPNDPVTVVGNATIRAMTSDADLSYKVTSGDGSTWKSDTASGLKISANGEQGKFSYIMIDGKLIEPSEYTISGSKTDAVLSADLLKRLGEGKHAIMIVYDDGWASASFAVVGDRKNSEDDDHSSADDHHDAEDGHRDSGDSHHYSEDESNALSSRLSYSKISSPQTGDNRADDVPVYLLILLFSFVSIVVVKRRVPGAG